MNIWSYHMFSVLFMFPIHFLQVPCFKRSVILYIYVECICTNACTHSLRDTNSKHKAACQDARDAGSVVLVTHVPMRLHYARKDSPVLN